MTGLRPYTCQDCGTEGLSHGKRGRLPQRCAACKSKRARPARLCGVVCRHCNKEFHASCRSRMYCDDCLPIYRPAAERFKCKACGASFTKRGGKSYLTYCSRTCWIQHKFVPSRERRQRQELIRKWIENVNTILQPTDAAIAAIMRDIQTARPCWHCGCLLVGGQDVPGGGYDRFCSDDCRIESGLRKRRKLKRGRGSQKHTSRAKKRGLPRQYSIRIAKVADRDRWMCRLCGRPVDESAHHASPMAACIDHIVPLNLRSNSRHGHTWDNVQLAHRVCNEAKGCSLACGALLECNNPRLYVQMHNVDQTPPRWGSLAQEAFFESPTRPLREFLTS